ncbi:Unknown protein, partial [Striga hermonthica]
PKGSHKRVLPKSIIGKKTWKRKGIKEGRLSSNGMECSMGDSSTSSKRPREPEDQAMTLEQEDDHS